MCYIFPSEFLTSPVYQDMWLLLRSTHEYTVGNNLITFLVQLFPRGGGFGGGRTELSRKQDERGKKMFL